MNRAKPTDSLAARLALRVEKGDPTACWNWTGSQTRGYGVMNIGSSRTQLAHRVAWIVANGSIPDGLLVCHRCDNPACCNPAHLFLGTDRDNHNDKIAKGRARAPAPKRGESNCRAKLTAKEVLSILADRRSNVALAREHAVSPSLISLIRRGGVWKHLLNLENAA
jgi:hypothetical protein